MSGRRDEVARVGDDDLNGGTKGRERLGSEGGAEGWIEEKKRCECHGDYISPSGFVSPLKDR